MANKVITILLVAVFIALAIGFYILYTGGDHVWAQKVIGGSTVFLFFVLMPAFLIVRYKDKKLKSFVWNPDDLTDEEE